MKVSKLVASIATVALAGTLLADNSAKPAGEPVLDAPTFRSLGGYWIISGDDNANATITLQYREAGAGNWTTGMPLFRVEKGAHDPTKAEHRDKAGKSTTPIEVPDGAWLFAGSALLLDPGTDYELKLRLNDPDGGEVEKTLKARTAAEPIAPVNAPIKYVAPGTGGGSGTKEDPFRGLKAAQKAARPGDVLLLTAGTYQEHPITVTASGEPGRPIIWRGEDRAKVILQGGPASAADIDLARKAAAARKGEKYQHPGFVERVIDASNNVHDVWFENLSIANGNHAIVAHNSRDIVLRGCHIHDVFYGLTATKNVKDQMTGMYVLDNVIEGVSTWPRSRGIEESRGVQIAGRGNVVAYNRFARLGDAIDTFGSPRTEAMDFHNNDIYLCTDDGIETDYSQHNVRVFENRLTNVFQGISAQPTYGGPVYIFRNTLYNVAIEPFKLHNTPSGVFIAHNTVVKQTFAWELQSPKTTIHNITLRNNLFLGNAAAYTVYLDAKDIEGCDFDYDGFGMMSATKNFLRFNKQKFPSVEAFKAAAPFEKHLTIVDPKTAFASGVTPPDDTKKELPIADLRPGDKSDAIDKGVAIPGLNDGFQGVAPDLGAFERGAELPHYGPRQ